MNGHPLRRLGQDVDIHTMYHMRDQGMSNKEIAQALGVSYATVYKYIGKQERRGGDCCSALCSTEEDPRGDLHQDQKADPAGGQGPQLCGGSGRPEGEDRPQDQYAGCIGP